MSPQAEGGGPNESPRQRLRRLINEWEELRRRIARHIDALDRPESEVFPDRRRELEAELEELRSNRASTVDAIGSVVTANPHLYNAAINMGFRRDLLNEHYTESGGDGGGEPAQGGQGGGESIGSNEGNGNGNGDGDPHVRDQVRDNRLLGEFGKQYTLVRGPKGTYVAKYRFRIAGEVFDIGIKLGRDPDALRRYGLRASDARELTAAQFKRIKRIGNADELSKHMRRGDKDVFESLTRYLNNQYEGQPILNNKGVMSVIIANSLFGWSTGEFENQLRNTPWYKQTEPYQRDWMTVTSDRQKRNAIQKTLEQVTDALEDNFGLGWNQYIKGGIQKAREWAETIASGTWGEPGEGFQFWNNRMFDRAAKINGTPAWIAQQQEQEQQRDYMNRPEDMYERLRGEAMSYLGQSNGRPLLDENTLRTWASDLVTNKRPQSDWQQFLRNQMRRLHPYFDENVAFTEQASPYKSLAEGLLNTTLTWDDPLLRGFNATDKDGNPVNDQAMSLSDYDLMLRDPDRNPRAYQRGTRLWDEGMGLLDQLEHITLGVS